MKRTSGGGGRSSKPRGERMQTLREALVRHSGCGAWWAEAVMREEARGKEIEAR